MENKDYTDYFFCSFLFNHSTAKSSNKMLKKKLSSCENILKVKSKNKINNHRKNMNLHRADFSVPKNIKFSNFAFKNRIIFYLLLNIISQIEM